MATSGKMWVSVESLKRLQKDLGDARGCLNTYGRSVDIGDVTGALEGLFGAVERFVESIEDGRYELMDRTGKVKPGPAKERHCSTVIDFEEGVAIFCPADEDLREIDGGLWCAAHRGKGVS